MLLECTECPGRGRACGGCFVAALLDPRPALPPDVAGALDVLQEAGLIGPVHLALVDGPSPVPAASTRPLHVVGRRRAG